LARTEPVGRPHGTLTPDSNDPPQRLGVKAGPDRDPPARSEDEFDARAARPRVPPLGTDEPDRYECGRRGRALGGIPFAPRSLEGVLVRPLDRRARGFRARRVAGAVETVGTALARAQGRNP
jgi:hypothetical protein